MFGDPRFSLMDHFLYQLSAFCEKLKKICVVEVWVFSIFYFSSTVLAKAHLKGWVYLKGWHQFKLFTWQTQLNEIILTEKVGLQGIIFNTFQLTTTKNMSSYEDQFLKIRVVLHVLYFENEVSEVSISDIGNSLPDCSRSMKNLCCGRF